MKKQIRNTLILLCLVFNYKAICISDIRINESFRNTTLKEALTILKTNYDLKIAYSDQAINSVILDVEIENLTVYETFQRILESSVLTFELLEGNVVIVKKMSKSDESPSSNISIIGVVQDAYSGERLPYAYLWLERENRNLVSNLDGYFTVSGTSLPSSLRVSYLGYQDTTFILDEQSENRRLYVNLVAKPHELNEVIISGKITDNFEINKSSGKIDLNPKIAYSMPSAGEPDLLRTIQLLPGINATNEVSSGLSIQGGTANQNLFLFDGFTVYHIDHFFGYFSAFNPSAVKSVQLYKGGYDARYGGRVSGIIDITGKEGNLNEIGGSLGMNLLSVNTSLEIPVIQGKSSLYFSGRRSYTDIVSTTLFENIFSNFSSGLSKKDPPQQLTNKIRNHHGTMDRNPEITTVKSSLNPEFYYSDLNLKYSTRLGAKNHLSFSFYDSNDILNFKESNITNVGDTLTISTNTIGVINWGNIGSSLKFSRLWNQTHYSNALLSYSNYKSTYDEITNTSATNSNQVNVNNSFSSAQDNAIKDLSFKVDHELFLPNEQQIRVGLHSSLFETQYLSKSNNSEIVNEIQTHKLLISGYVLNIFQPFSGMQINMGFRGNYYSSTAKWYAEPRISFAYQASSKFRIKSAFGIYHQFINQSNTKNTLQGSRDFWLLADDVKIPIQKSRHLTGGLEYRIENSVFSVDYFKKDFTGLMEYAFQNGGLITEFSNYRKLFFEGEGQSQGIELLAKRSGNTFNSWIGYTLSEVRQSFDEINNGESYYADHDQRHELNIYGSMKFNKFEIYATWLYGSGKPFSRNNGLLQPNPNYSNYNENVVLLDIDKKNGLRLPSYHRMDVGGNYYLSVNNFNATIALSVFNLYDKQNILDIKFQQIQQNNHMDPQKNNAIVQLIPVTSLGITPNLSVTIDF